MAILAMAFGAVFRKPLNPKDPQVRERLEKVRPQIVERIQTLSPAKIMRIITAEKVWFSKPFVSW